MTVVGIDFDNTLVHYESGMAAFGDVGPTFPGAVAFLRALGEVGIRVRIFSARASDARGKRTIEEWVRQNQLEDVVESVTHEKLPEMAVIVDDRAIHFDGNYRAILKEIIRRLREEE